MNDLDAHLTEKTHFVVDNRYLKALGYSDGTGHYESYKLSFVGVKAKQQRLKEMRRV